MTTVPDSMLRGHGRASSNQAPFTPTGLDALPPADVARKAATVGVTKAGMPALDVFVLAATS